MPLDRCFPPFPRAEYETRLARVRAAMQRRSLDRLLVSGATAIAWLTGYDADSDYVPQMVLVGNDAEPVLFLREMDLSGALHMAWLPEQRMIGYPEDYIGTADRDGYDFILAWLTNAGQARGRIGAFLERLPSRITARLVAGLPNATVETADDLIDWLRIKKSPAEVQVMREAARITDYAMQTAYDNIAPGVREAEAAAAVSAALIAGVDGLSGDRIISPLMPSGSRTGAAHLGWSDGRYGSRGSVNLELGASRWGYCAALMRSVALGRPSSRLAGVHQASLAGLESALETARPGTVCEEIAKAYTAAAGRYGFVKRSRCGYPIGLHWMEPTASFREGDTTELRPGMTFHLMLGNWITRDFGHVLSETILITEAGAECLTRTSRDLHVCS